MGLAELHTDDEVSIPGYKLVKQKFMEKPQGAQSKQGGGGGLAVFVKNDLQNIVKVVPNTNEDSIWIKLNSHTCTRRYFYWYILHESHPQN